MVTVDETKPRGLAPPFCQRLLKTSAFHIVTLLLVLANAVTVATMNFDIRNSVPENPVNGYYYAEVSKMSKGLFGLDIMLTVSSLFTVSWL